MREIPLTQNKVALVDDEDYDALIKYKWFAHLQRNGDFYAGRQITIGPYKQQTMHMHTEITGYIITDHINGNGLDNRKENLRRSTNSQNSRNMRKRTGTSSKFKGVHFHPKNLNWIASIRVNYRLIHLGSYKLEVDAAIAYDNAAIMYFGQFAKTNKSLGLLEGL